MRHPRRTASVFTAVLVLAGLVAGSAIFGPAPAAAHDYCQEGVPSQPRKESGKVRGKISYLCNSQHAAYLVDGCLQKYRSGSWVNIDCDLYDTYIGGTGGSNCNCYGAWIDTGHVCEVGSWRTMIRYGEARNVSGDMAHWQTLDEPSSSIYVSSC